MGEDRFDRATYLSWVFDFKLWLLILSAPTFSFIVNTVFHNVPFTIPNEVFS